MAAALFLLALTASALAQPGYHHDWKPSSALHSFTHTHSRHAEPTDLPDCDDGQLEVDESRFPSVQSFKEIVSVVGNLGLRTPASPRQNILIDYLAEQLHSIPDMQVQIDGFPILKWQTADDKTLRQAGSLTLQTSNTTRKLPIIGAIPWTQPTGSSPVTGELLYVPLSINLRNVSIKGKIVMRDFGPTAKPTYEQVFLPQLYRSEDTNDLLSTSYDRPYTGAPVTDLVNAGLGGAAGFISIFNVSESFLESYFDPHDGTHYRLPGVYVGEVEANILKSSKGEATIDVQAIVANATERQITATLPGMTNETIYIVCHTDGNTWVQDDGVSALLNIARYFGHLEAERQKTLRFVFTTGHLGSVGDTTYALAAKLDSTYDTDDTVLAIALEHLGTREVLPRGSPSGGANGQPLEFTGKSEIMMWSVGPSSPLQDAAIAAAKKYDLDRMLVTKGVNKTGDGIVPEYSFGGLGSSLHAHLIPTTSIISGPWSLWAPAFGETALDFGRLRDQTMAFAELIVSVDSLSKAEIAGDYMDERAARANGTKRGLAVVVPPVQAPAAVV